MYILLKLAYLRKLLPPLLMAATIYITGVSVALHSPFAHHLLTVESAYAAECSDGTCGRFFR